MKKRPFTRNDKKAKIRKAIIQAAADLFERQGFENTSVDDIAAEAEVSRSTFYRNFPTKEQVTFPTHDDYVAHFRELLAENHNADSALLTMRGAFLAMAERYMATRDEHLRYMRIITVSPALVARSVALDIEWEETIASAWRKKLGRVPGADWQAGMAAGAIMGVVNFAMSQWYRGECRQHLPDFIDPAFELLSNGLGGAEKQSPQDTHAVASEWKSARPRRKERGNER